MGVIADDRDYTRRRDWDNFVQFLVGVNLCRTNMHYTQLANAEIEGTKGLRIDIKK